MDLYGSCLRLLVLATIIVPLLSSPYLPNIHIPSLKLMCSLPYKFRLYVVTTVSALSGLLISHRAMAQGLPPANQVGDIAAHEICGAIADGRLDEQTTNQEFETVFQVFFERVDRLYGQEMSAALADRLDTIFDSPGPPLDPYFMELSQNFLRFVTADTFCYSNLYTFLSAPTQVQPTSPSVPLEIPSPSAPLEIPSPSIRPESPPPTILPEPPSPSIPPEGAPDHQGPVEKTPDFE